MANIPRYQSQSAVVPKARNEQLIDSITEEDNLKRREKSACHVSDLWVKVD
jgi:hypothetical protein